MVVAINTIDTLQSGATASVNGALANVAGWDGSFYLFISNGAGTATVTVQTSLDSTFAAAQDRVVPPVLKLWDSTNGSSTSGTTVSGVIAVAANTSYFYVLEGTLPYVRTPISSASGLGAGTSSTGLTVVLYRMPA